MGYHHYQHYAYLPAPTYQAPHILTTVLIPEDYSYTPAYACPQYPEIVSPPLTVLQTKDLPLTPAKSTNLSSEKKMGKSLSRFTKNMEMVWHGEFNRLCQHFLPNCWYLSPEFDIPRGNQWVTFKDSAKVRFLCKICSHGWTSMKGRVVFWFKLDDRTSNGVVFFRLFGQRCQACSPPSFEHAMWYPEEVLKVIGNLFNRIGQEYYGFYSPPVRVDRRAGKPRSKHNSQLCQACFEGVCPRYVPHDKELLAIENLATAAGSLSLSA